MRRTVVALALAAAGCASSTRYVDSTDGVKLFVREVGAGPVVVAIHGGPGLDHGSLAADFVPLENQHHVVFYDQRGGGRSSLPADVRLLTIAKDVEDLEALRRDLGIEKLTLVAHSFGPAIAARYAIAHPDRVARMVFLGPIPPRKATFFEDYGRELNSRMTPDQQARAEALNRQMAKGVDVVAACREYWKLETPPRLAKGTDASLVKSDLCTAPAEAIRFGMTTTGPATWGSLGEWDWTAELRKVNVPLLVIHGDQDAIPLALVREWATAMPDARIMVLPDTGHFPHAEKPDLVWPAIETFLGGQWPDGAR